MSSESHSTSDESLAVAAASEDAAFAELLRRYQSPLLGFLRRFTQRHADAEDLLQETVVRLYASRRQYRSRWKFRTWAFTIARRAAIDAHRCRAREAAAMRNLRMDSSRFDSREESACDSADVIWSLARRVLTVEQAQALWLFHVEEIPPREIARILDRSWVSVRTMLHRARKAVRMSAGPSQLGPATSATPARGAR